MTLAQFVDEVMAGSPAESGAPEVRYVFNTLTNHKLGKDFAVPEIVSRAVMKPAAVGEDYTTKPGVFEWILGPAGSGSHPHCHSGAWNALVYGEKRWLVWSVLKNAGLLAACRNVRLADTDRVCAVTPRPQGVAIHPPLRRQLEAASSPPPPLLCAPYPLSVLFG